MERQYHSLFWLNLYTPTSVCIFSLLFFILQGADKESLFNNQQLVQLVIISLILVTLMSDSGAIFQGELNARHSQESSGKAFLSHYPIYRIMIFNNIKHKHFLFLFFPRHLSMGKCFMMKPCPLSFAGQVFHQRDHCFQSLVSISLKTWLLLCLFTCWFLVQIMFLSTRFTFLH